MRIHHSKELGRTAAYLASDQGNISFDGGDADASAGIEPGTLVALRTSSKLLVAWDPKGTGGIQKLKGILDEAVYEVGAGATQRVGVCARLAEVKATQIRFPETVTLAEATTALEALTIIVR